VLASTVFHIGDRRGDARELRRGLQAQAFTVGFRLSLRSTSV
jgi:hypothetical protein